MSISRDWSDRTRIDNVYCRAHSIRNNNDSAIRCKMSARSRGITLGGRGIAGETFHAPDDSGFMISRDFFRFPLNEARAGGSRRE